MPRAAWLGLGIVVLLIGMGAYWAGSREITRADDDYRSIGSALGMYRNLAGCHPSTEQGLAALVQKPTTAPLPKRWAPAMETLPTDDWGHRYQYLLFPAADPRIFEIRSLGPDGKLSEDDVVRYGSDLKEHTAKEFERGMPAPK